MSNEVRFRKILALAVNPAAPHGEAQAAFGKLRELVRQDPNLSSLPEMPPPAPVQAEDMSVQWLLTNVASSWFGIVIDILSGVGYDLGLRCRVACDFKQLPTAITFTCTGTKEACDHFANSLTTLMNHINSQPDT